MEENNVNREHKDRFLRESSSRRRCYLLNTMKRFISRMKMGMAKALAVDIMSKLYIILKESGRLEDYEKAVTDSEFRN